MALARKLQLSFLAPATPPSSCPVPPASSMLWQQAKMMAAVKTYKGKRTIEVGSVYSLLMSPLFSVFHANTRFIK